MARRTSTPKQYDPLRREEYSAQSRDCLHRARIAMRQAHTHLARWDIICEPKRLLRLGRDFDDFERHGLVDYAIRTWPDFSAWLTTWRQGLARELRARTSQMQAAQHTQPEGSLT